MRRAWFSISLRSCCDSCSEFGSICWNCMPFCMASASCSCIWRRYSFIACCSSFIRRSISSSEAPRASASSSSRCNRRSSRIAMLMPPSSSASAVSHISCWTSASSSLPIGSEVRRLIAKSSAMKVVMLLSNASGWLISCANRRATAQGAGARILGQALALLDDGARHRMIELALRQRHGDRRGGADLAQRVARHRAQLDRQSGPRMRGQVLEAGALHLARVGALDGQRQLDRSPCPG